MLLKNAKRKYKVTERWKTGPGYGVHELGSFSSFDEAKDAAYAHFENMTRSKVISNLQRDQNKYAKTAKIAWRERTSGNMGFASEPVWTAREIRVH